MGNMILCCSKMADNPYLIEGSSLEVYSLEELCCYIMQNSILLDASFMKLSLCDWVEKELLLPETADELREMIASRKSVSDFIRLLLSQCDYCTKEEQRRIVHAVASMEKKTEYERRKQKADLFCKKGKYSNAVREYQLITAKEFYPRPDALFMGAIWHNLGTAYAKLFLFAEAEEAYEKAYGLNEDRDSLRAMLIASLCRKKETHFKELCARYYVDERNAQKLLSEFWRASEHYAGHRYYDHLNELRDCEGTDSQIAQKEEELLLILKEDYRRVTRL